MVDGTIDGHPYRFVVDTGAARTHVVADAFTSGFPSLRRHDSSGAFAASNDVLIELPDVTVGSMHRGPIEVVRLPVGQPGGRNLLGMDVLKAYRCHFLFDQQRLVVGHSEPGGISHDLRMDHVAHPYVDVRFPDSTAQTVWDSGAGITVVDQGFLMRHAKWFRRASFSVGTDATGAQVETPTFIMAETSIGGVAFASHRVAAVDLSPANAALTEPMDMILGYTTLRQASWLFDFPAQRWAVAPRPG